MTLDISIEIVAKKKARLRIRMHTNIYYNAFDVKCKWRSGSREFQLNLFGVCVCDGVAFVYRVL